MIRFNTFETYEVVFEIYIEDNLVQKQTIQAPKEMLIINFLQTAEQIKNDKRPMKIKMLRQDVVWDAFDNKQKVLNNEISASNNAMIIFEENKEEANKERH